MKTTKLLEYFWALIILVLMALVLFACSVSVPVKGNARIDTSGTQKITTEGTTTVNVNLELDIADQVKQICTSMTNYQECEQQIVQIYADAMAAIKNAKDLAAKAEAAK